MKDINVISRYGILEFFKNEKPIYRLSKNKNSNQYSILDYKKGLITFFMNGWDKKRLIKEYITILSNWYIYIKA